MHYYNAALPDEACYIVIKSRQPIQKNTTMKATLVILLSALALALAACKEEHRKEAQSVGEYGVGVVQQRAGKKAIQKVQKAQDQHNKQLDDALKD